MSASNFYPNGNTFSANVPGFGGSVGFYVTSTVPTDKWLIQNGSNNSVFFRISSNLALANTSLSLPADNTSAPGQFISPGDTYIVGLPTADGPNVSGQRYISNVAVVATSATVGYSYLSVTPVLQQFQ